MYAVFTMSLPDCQAIWGFNHLWCCWFRASILSKATTQLKLGLSFYRSILEFLIYVLLELGPDLQCFSLLDKWTTRDSWSDTRLWKHSHFCLLCPCMATLIRSIGLTCTLNRAYSTSYWDTWMGITKCPWACPSLVIIATSTYQGRLSPSQRPQRTSQPYPLLAMRCLRHTGHFGKPARAQTLIRIGNEYTSRRTVFSRANNAQEDGGRRL